MGEEVAIIRYKRVYKNGENTQKFDRIIDIIPFNKSILNGSERYDTWYDPKTNYMVGWYDVVDNIFAFKQVFVKRINLYTGNSNIVLQQIKQIRREKRLKKLLGQ